MENRTTQQWVFAQEDLVAMYGMDDKELYGVTKRLRVIRSSHLESERAPQRPLEGGATSSKTIKKVMNCLKSWAN